MSEAFLFDDYFSSDKDRGVEVILPFKGRLLPFRVKRSLTLKEKQRASDAAVKIELDAQGMPKLSGSPDQAAFTTEILLVGLLFWPFEYQEGKPVPINKESISKLDSTLAEQLAARILGITPPQEEALVPFERKSDAA